MFHIILHKLRKFSFTTLNHTLNLLVVFVFCLRTSWKIQIWSSLIGINKKCFVIVIRTRSWNCCNQSLAVGDSLNIAFRISSSFCPSNHQTALIDFCTHFHFNFSCNDKRIFCNRTNYHICSSAVILRKIWKLEIFVQIHFVQNWIIIINMYDCIKAVYQIMCNIAAEQTI